MSGSQASSAGLDPRRRRILFRSWHRGIREMDLLFGRFADAEIGNLSERELAEFETLMEEQDRDVFGWLTGEALTPPGMNTGLLARIREFHLNAAPL